MKIHITKASDYTYKRDEEVPEKDFFQFLIGLSLNTIVKAPADYADKEVVDVTIYDDYVE